jgi:hypothetical protein
MFIFISLHSSIFKPMHSESGQWTTALLISFVVDSSVAVIKEASDTLCTMDEIKEHIQVCGHAC